MSEVSDLSEVVDDGVLSESFTIQRSTGHFAQGGWVLDSSVNVAGWGVVSVASEQDLMMIPEGDRVTGKMVFHTKSRIYETQLDGSYGSQGYGQGVIGTGATTQRFSDIMIWNYQQWRILAVAPYPNRRFWKAIGVRIAGI
jgi:hypothetical protein